MHCDSKAFPYNIHLFKDDTLGVGGTTEGRWLESSSKKTLLELLVSPTVLATMGAQLACGVKTTRLSLTYCREKRLYQYMLLWRANAFVVGEVVLTYLKISKVSKCRLLRDKWTMHTCRVNEGSNGSNLRHSDSWYVFRDVGCITDGDRSGNIASICCILVFGCIFHPSPIHRPKIFIRLKKWCIVFVASIIGS